MFATIAQLLGVAVLANLAYRVVACVHLYAIQKSTIKNHLREDGKAYALVTGASDGIGLELVKVLLARGFNLILHSRNEEKLTRITNDLRTTYPEKDILHVAADATDPKVAVPKVAAAIGKVEGKGGRLTVLVNNVGGQSLFGDTTFTAFKDMKLETITKTIELNAVFPIQLTKVLYPSLENASGAGKPGLVINVGSFAGVYPIPMGTIYGASKAMLHHLTRVVGSENAISAKPAVDVLGVIIGGVKTYGNAGMTETSFSVASADRCARCIVDRVGCGYDLVVADWRQCVTAGPVKYMPEWMVRNIMQAQIDKLTITEKEVLAKRI